MANIVELHQICKSYGEGTSVANEVLHGLDLAIAEGKFAALTALRGRTIGFIFQFHHLLPAFTALENVMMPSIIDSGWRLRARCRCRRA